MKRFYLRGKCIGDTEIKDGKSTVLSIQQIINMLNDLYEENLRLKIANQREFKLTEKMIEEG